MVVSPLCIKVAHFLGVSSGSSKESKRTLLVPNLSHLQSRNLLYLPRGESVATWRYLPNLEVIHYSSLYGTIKTLQDNIGLYSTIHDYTGLYRNIQNYTGLYRTIHDYTELYGTIKDYKYLYIVLYRIIHDYTGLLKTIQDYTWLYRTIYDSTELHRTIQINTGLYRTIQYYIRLYRTIQDYIGPELEIVVELGNLVPRKNLVLQKVFLLWDIYKIKKRNVSEFLQKLCILNRTYQFLWNTHDFLCWNTITTLFLRIITHF